MEAAWWTPETAAILCRICGRGGGWVEYGPVTPEEYLVTAEEGRARWGACHKCFTRQPYCG